MDDDSYKGGTSYYRLTKYYDYWVSESYNREDLVFKLHLEYVPNVGNLTTSKTSAAGLPDGKYAGKPTVNSSIPMSWGEIKELQQRR